MLTLEVCETPARYLAAATASGQPVPAFLHPRFLHLAARTTHRTLRPLVVRYRSTDVGVAPWLENRKGPVATVNQVPFPYAGPLVPPELLAATLEQLRSRGLRRGVAVQEHEFSPTTEVDDAALAVGEHDELVHEDTYVISTAGTPEEIDRRIDKRSMRQLRKAAREGVETVELTDDALAPRALDLTLDSIYADKSHSSGYRDPLGVLPRELVGEGLDAQWLVAVRDGVTLGCLLSVAYQDSSIAWLGGVIKEHRNTQANLLLYRSAIGWAARVGATGLDLSGNPTPQIRAFKKQFGGTLCHYAKVTHHPRWARGALAARQALSDLPRRRG